MKKLVLMLAVVFSASLFSCGGNTSEAAAEAADTAAVVEEVAVDTAVVADSAAVDTVVAVAAEVAEVAQ